MIIIITINKMAKEKIVIEAKIEEKKEETLIEKQLKDLIPRLSERIASANINFLIGSWISKPYLPTLYDIETNINNAKNDDEKANEYKEYFEKVMLPNKNIISDNFSEESSFEWWEEKWKDNWWIIKDIKKSKEDFESTQKDYKNFLSTLNQLILDRKTTVLSKQINIFTTNIDIFFEQNLEELELHYNDWFLGKMNPVFDLSNFKQSIIQRSHHFDNRSEIPVFNLLKIHGSVNWKYKESESSNPDRKIYLSSDLSHLDKGLLKDKSTDFIENYKEQILVVNPEDAKFSETVLNKYYYELLRSYSSELERENSILFIIGFSMADQHIREITKRASRSNPTLQIYILLHSKEKGKKEWEMEQLMEVSKNPNIKVIAPIFDKKEDKYNFDLDTITKEIFKKINKKFKNEW